MANDQNGYSNGRWQITKEKILMFSGLVLCFSEFVAVEALNRPFHVEWLVLGAALCGVSLASWGDKK